VWWSLLIVSGKFPCAETGADQAQTDSRPRIHFLLAWKTAGRPCNGSLKMRKRKTAVFWVSTLNGCLYFQGYFRQTHTGIDTCCQCYRWSVCWREPCRRAFSYAPYCSVCPEELHASASSPDYCELCVVEWYTLLILYAACGGFHRVRLCIWVEDVGRLRFLERKCSCTSPSCCQSSSFRFCKEKDLTEYQVNVVSQHVLAKTIRSAQLARLAHFCSRGELSKAPPNACDCRRAGYIL
jgi:hypothetical protein